MYRSVQQLVRIFTTAVTPARADTVAISTPVAQHTPGSVYHARRVSRVLPGEVRRKRFSPTKFGRRGLDPSEVHHFLNRVAEEMNALYRDLSASQEHAARLRNALREWQTQNASRHVEHDPPPAPPSQSHAKQVSPPHPNTRFMGGGSGRTWK
ncbi:DivIVA domain-containing protein [Micromonospora sp. NPDC049679]|uniref:DivIVA domain-containing protein n=1 Tax=Micromonospora sp. NPDC049679 TaxID=3155920 RepID=UPI003410D108